MMPLPIGRKKLSSYAAMLLVLTIGEEGGSIVAMTSSNQKFWVTRWHPSTLLHGRKGLYLWMRLTSYVLGSSIETTC
jgi:hypothetical protein